MSLENSLDDLASDWLAAKESGLPQSPTALCHDRPDLLPALEQRVRDLESMARFVGEPSPQQTGDTAIFTPLSRPAVETVNFPSKDNAHSESRDQLSRLGEYVIRGEIGRGGMGEVLLADDPQLGRQVAIKVMRQALGSSPDARARFLREARAVAAIRHDHVVPIYHVGEHEGTPYLVMPLLAGETLSTRLERGPLPPAEVARVGREMAEGLAAAHERGLIHRDVKPANVWLDIPGDRVRLLDFGLARSADGTDGLTQPGVVMGTLAYMAPEQADGLEVDGRADLFSLGAVLYQCATGRPPFTGKTLSATMRAVAEHTPPPPLNVNPEVPVGLSDLVMRLLSKQPGGRPGSAMEVAACLSGVPTNLAETITIQAPPSKRWRNWPLAAAAVMVIGTLIAILWPSRDREIVPEIVQVESPVPPLDDRLVVRIWSIDKSKQGLQLGRDAGALPARAGDSVRAEVSLNQPAHIYLLVLDAQGNVVPLYPWHRDGKRLDKSLIDPPPVVGAESSLIWPSRESESGLELDESSGQETILMLARRTPLPSEVKLAEITGRLPLSPTPLENLETFAMRGSVNGHEESAIRIDQHRGFNTELKKIDDPLDRLITRLQPHFDLVRAVRFAHVGK